jgi:DNA mismatch endonuclease (patch repair protein)
MDKLTKERRSWNMSKIRGKDTGPELVLRRYLHSKGFRYRVNVKLPGKPDIAVKKIKTAIFVNGCFWHGHTNCKEGNLPKTNTDFWRQKITGNTNRDARNEKLLKDSGWHVLVVWQCEIEKDRENTLHRVERALQSPNQTRAAISARSPQS